MSSFCFVMLPAGKREDGSGRLVDFDGLYTQVVVPALENARLEPIRAPALLPDRALDPATVNHLLHCELVIADFTLAPPDAAFRLGMRHAFQAGPTIILHGAHLPSPLGTGVIPVGYEVANDGSIGAATALAALFRAVSRRQEHRRDDVELYHVLAGYPPRNVEHTRTDLFRTYAGHPPEVEKAIADARSRGGAAVRQLARELPAGDDAAWPVWVDLLLALRGVEAHEEMIDLVNRMPGPLREVRVVQEQLAFALNRAGRAEEAAEILSRLIATKGANSETNGLLGRVYKDRWDQLRKSTADQGAQRAALQQAIDTYFEGFAADWRDAYPGINAATLMSLARPPDGRAAEILPVVRYAAGQRVRRGGDYWDHATLIEAAALSRNREMAEQALAGARERVRESWEPKTTARNLGLIRQAALEAGERLDWLLEVEAELGMLAAQRGGSGR